VTSIPSPAVTHSESALDRLIPEPGLREVDSVELAMPAAEAWELVRHADIADSAVLHALFAIRTLPDRLRRRTPDPIVTGLDDFASTPERPGFQVLVDDPPHEVAVGAIGAVWRPRIPFVHVDDATAFAAYATPGVVRVAWSISVQAFGPDTSMVRLEVRVDATDPESWRRFTRYFRFIGPESRFLRRRLLSQLARRGEHVAAATLTTDWRDVLAGLGGVTVIAGAFATPFLRRRRARWGVNEATAARALPGDALVPVPRWQWTHGVEVDAPAAEVWPWVAQVGADRAGFYSYQWLEDLAGCRITNADRVHPEWQVHVGDALRLHPDMPPLPIVEVHEGHHFVAHAQPVTGGALSDEWVDVSWLFLVEAMYDRRCRVISRYRCATSNRPATRLQFGPTLVEPISFAMDRRMLRGIKARAERAHR
jgi:hypothetical protein